MTVGVVVRRQWNIRPQEISFHKIGPIRKLRARLSSSQLSCRPPSNWSLVSRHKIDVAADDIAFSRICSSLFYSSFALPRRYFASEPCFWVSALNVRRWSNGLLCAHTSQVCGGHHLQRLHVGRRRLFASRNEARGWGRSTFLQRASSR